MRRFFPAFMIAVALTALPSCDTIKKKQQRREAVKELEEIRKAAGDSFEMTEEGLAVDHDKMNERLQSFEKTADKLGGKMGEALKITADMAKHDTEVGKQIEGWTERVISSLDWKNLAEVRDYDARIQLMTEYKEFNQWVIKDQKTYAFRLAKRLDDIQFTGKEREGYEKGVLSQMSQVTPYLEEVRLLDTEIADVATGIFRHLKKIDKSWNWNATTDNIEFESTEDVEFFNTETAKFQVIGNKQIEAQKKMMQAIRPK